MSSHAIIADEVALHTLEYAVVDVETTGHASVGPDRVTEVGIVCVRGGETIDEFEALVNPGRPVPPFITRLTGITNAMVAGAPRFDAIAPQVRTRLEARVFVAHNAQFDWSFIGAEFNRISEPAPSLERLCTVRLARRLLAHLPRRNLDAVAAHYGIRNDARHRALGDARVTAQVFARMLDELGESGVHTWSDLMRYLRRRRPRRSAFPGPMTDFRIA